MTVQLGDLIVPPSQPSILALLLKYLGLGGFPATSWQPGSVPNALLNAYAYDSADAWQSVAAVAAGGYLETASGDWLTLLAHNVYQVERKAPVFAQGKVTLTDAAGAGPFTITSGAFWVQATTGQRFSATQTVTLPKSGTITLSVQAESPGSGWNIQNATLTTLLTSLPGVLVTNPAVGGGSWLTQTGADAESDDSLVARCKARWPGLGGGATTAVYQAWALAASTEVQQVAVFENTPTDGQVTVVLASNNAGVSTTAVSVVAAYLAVRRPLCVKVNVQSAAQLNIPVTGTFYVRAGLASTALATAATQLNAYAGALGIGGRVYLAAVIEQLMLVPGAVNVTLTAPSSDVVLTPVQIANLQPALTVVSV